MSSQPAAYRKEAECLAQVSTNNTGFKVDVCSETEIAQRVWPPGSGTTWIA